MKYFTKTDKLMILNTACIDYVASTSNEKVIICNIDLFMKTNMQRHVGKQSLAFNAGDTNVFLIILSYDLVLVCITQRAAQTRFTVSPYSHHNNESYCK
jgi:hypothetical protein